MSTRRKLEELLDSDDELPTSYKEVTFIPAYQDDSRFNDIDLYQLTKDIYETSEESLSGASSLLGPEDKLLDTITGETREYNSVLLTGVLSRKDAYCIKVFGTVYDDETLLWFINFTISKDVQSNYSFLISCLVGDEYDFLGTMGSFFNNVNKKKQNCDSQYLFDIYNK